MKSLAMITLSLALALGACKGKNQEPAPAPPSPAQVQPQGRAGGETGSAAAPVAEGTDTGSAGSAADEAPVDVATEMDYEDLATDEITEATVENKLKALEGELAE
jgi:hypothetical protein